jgi:hypothetical protein
MQQLCNRVFKVSHHAIFIPYLCLRKIDGTMKFMIEDKGQRLGLAKVVSLQNTKLALGLASMKERIELSSDSFANDCSGTDDGCFERLRRWLHTFSSAMISPSRIASPTAEELNSNCLPRHRASDLVTTL